VLNWKQFVLYPEGVSPTSCSNQANLTVPNSGVMEPRAFSHDSGIEMSFDLRLGHPWCILRSPPACIYRTIELGTEKGFSHFPAFGGDSETFHRKSSGTGGSLQKTGHGNGALFESVHYPLLSFSVFTSRSHRTFGVSITIDDDRRASGRSSIPRTKAFAYLAAA